jgi:hypothetical protein
MSRGAVQDTVRATDGLGKHKKTCARRTHRAGASPSTGGHREVVVRGRPRLPAAVPDSF